MISAVHLYSFFFCFAILGVMAFHPHVLGSHDCNMAAMAPKITSPLQVGKIRKDSLSHIYYHFLEIPGQASFCISLARSGSRGHSWQQRVLGMQIAKCRSPASSRSRQGWAKGVGQGNGVESSSRLPARGDSATHILALQRRSWCQGQRNAYSISSLIDLL